MTVHTVKLFGALLAAAIPVTQSPAPSDDAAVVEAGAPSGPGLKVAIDPVTGEIIAEPTEADLEVLASGAERVRKPSAWTLRSFPLAHGGEGVFLDGWAEQALGVRLDAEGSLRLTCGADHQHDGDHASAADRSPGESNLK